MNEIFGLDIKWVAIIAANSLLIFLLLIMSILNNSKIKKLMKKYYCFMNGLGDNNIEGLLEKCIERLNGISERNKEIENHINGIERNVFNCIQKIGIVRFNAFDNVGSDLSYSIALLDANDDGVVVSGLYSRDNSASYAKPIIRGKSKYALSAEEIKAIDDAKKIHRQGA